MGSIQPARDLMHLSPRKEIITEGSLVDRPTIAVWAAALAERLESGALKDFGLIDLGDGPRMDAERAVRITLADVQDLLDQARDHHALDAARWGAVARLLEHLYVVTSPGADQDT